MRIIDADGHVAEGASLAIEAMQRWPDHIAPRADGRALVIEGRHYPEDQGPAPAAPGVRAQQGRRHQPVVARGRAGRRRRDHIDRWSSSRASALRARPRESRVRGRLRQPLQRVDRRLLRAFGRPAARRRGAPIERATSRSTMREVKELGLVAHVPPALKTRNLDHPDLDAFYAAAVELGLPLGVHGAPASTCRRSASTASRTTSRCTA